MATTPPSTIAEYIRAAPPAGQLHLRRLYAILGRVAPDAEETIKWGTPFFVEPRFVFAFSAHKAHCSFAPAAATLAAFRRELEQHETTKGTVQLRYDRPLSETLIRKLARHSLQVVRARKDDALW